MEWDKTPPRVPVLGTDEINNSPYMEKAENATLYNTYVESQVDVQSDYLSRGYRWIKSIFTSGGHRQLTDEQLIRMIHQDFPRRSEIMVDVMDFSPTESKRVQYPLHNVSACAQLPSTPVPSSRQIC